MSEIHVEFFDATRQADQSGGLHGDIPAAMGMPDCWLDALIGDGEVQRRDYVVPGVLWRIHARFPTAHHRDQFAFSVRKVSKLLGTWAIVHAPDAW
jgi:hypothetical protein